jgi:hypothetical protein
MQPVICTLRDSHHHCPDRKISDVQSSALLYGRFDVLSKAMIKCVLAGGAVVSLQDHYRTTSIAKRTHSSGGGPETG